MSYTIEPFLGSDGNGVTIAGGVTHEDITRLQGAYMALYGDRPEIGVRGKAMDSSGAPVLGLRAYLHLVIESSADGYWLVEHAGMRMSVRPHEGKWEYVRLQGHKRVWLGDLENV